MAMPADPAPLTTILISSIRLSTTRRALRMAAPTTMAVPSVITATRLWRRVSS